MSDRPFFSWRAAVVGSNLPATTKHILLTLSLYMNEFGESCFPSVATLMANSSLGKTAVIKHLREAATKGWITVSKHGFANRRWFRNEYKIAWPNGSKCVAPDEPVRANSDVPDRVVGGSPHEPDQECGGSPRGPVQADGGSPNDRVAGREVNPNSPKNSPEKKQFPPFDSPPSPINGLRIERSKGGAGVEPTEKDLLGKELRQAEPPAIVKRRTALPADWRSGIPPEQRSYAERQGMTNTTIAEEWRQFTNTAEAHGRIYKSWPAAWRSWIGNIDRFSPRRTGNGKGDGKARDGNQAFVDAARGLLAKYGAG